MTLGEIYDRMPEEQRKRAFFLLWGICEFYADGMTWFATSLVADPPAGEITRDERYDAELGRRAPGGRARLAFAWLLRAFERCSVPSPSGTEE